MRSRPTKRLLVCVNERLGYGQKSCAKSGSRALIEILQAKIAARQLDAEIVEQHCLGRCEEGVTMRIAPGGAFFTRVTEQDLEQIIRQLGDFKQKTELKS